MDADEQIRLVLIDQLDTLFHILALAVGSTFACQIIGTVTGHRHMGTTFLQQLLQLLCNFQIDFLDVYKRQARISAALHAFLSWYVGTVRTSRIPTIQKAHIICDHLCYIYTFAVFVIITACLDTALYTYQRALVRILCYTVRGLVPDDSVDEVSFWLSLLFEKPVTCDRKRHDRCAIRRLP